MLVEFHIIPYESFDVSIACCLGSISAPNRSSESKIAIATKLIAKSLAFIMKT